MASRDKLDPALAKHFAWCFAPPGAVVDVAERLRWAREEQAAYGESAVSAELVEPLELEDTPERARSLCSDLAAAIAEAWAEARLDVSVAATKRILSRADRLGV